MRHIFHVEDFLFNQGYPWVSIAFLQEVYNYLFHHERNIDISEKWDGSLGFVAGYDVANNFFVATKSAFNKTPKLCYTLNDIIYNHDDHDLQNKLSSLLRYLPCSDLEGKILQGDFLWAKEDLIPVINNERGYMFIPNVVEYHIADWQSSEIYIGVVFHTQYRDITFSDPKPYTAMLNNYDVWQPNKVLLAYKYIPNIVEITRLKEEIENFIYNRDVLQTLSVDPYRYLVTKFIHMMVQNGCHLPQTFKGREIVVNEFGLFVWSHYWNWVNEAKLDKTKMKRREELFTVYDYIFKNRKEIARIFELYSNLIQMKNLLMDCFENKHGVEGYVLYHKDMQYYSKMVDRNNFTRKNFEKYEKV